MEKNTKRDIIKVTTACIVGGAVILSYRTIDSLFLAEHPKPATGVADPNITASSPNKKTNTQSNTPPLSHVSPPEDKKQNTRMNIDSAIGKLDLMLKIADEFLSSSDKEKWNDDGLNIWIALNTTLSNKNTKNQEKAQIKARILKLAESAAEYATTPPITTQKKLVATSIIKSPGIKEFLGTFVINDLKRIATSG